MLKEAKRIHFIGVGGSGMNGIAEIFINMGYSVSGSDAKESENTRRVRGLGARVTIGHSAANVEGADAAVYSNAVPETNPELIKARKMKIPVIPRAMMLNEIMRLKTGIAIAGAHGKTTTTSMLAAIFEQAKLDPTYIIGGIVKAKGASARAGRGKYVIVEACEAYGSFLYLNPVIAGVTNIDNDHMDYYRKMDALKEAFKNFINKIPFYGAAYLNGDDEHVSSLLPELFVRVVTFGFGAKNDFRATRPKASGFSQRFSVTARGKSLGVFELNVPGEHNAANALLAIAVAHDLGIKTAASKRALKRFENVKRRFNVYTSGGVTVVDDYAHHPSEVTQVLKTAAGLAKKRVIAVFQPHLFSRTRQLYREFARSLSLADCVVLDSIYPAREAPVPGVTSGLIADEMRAAGYRNVWFEKDRNALLYRVKNLAKKGDYVVVLGAGNINEMVPAFVREFE